MRSASIIARPRRAGIKRIRPQPKDANSINLARFVLGQWRCGLSRAFEVTL
jgi:hypothetical protein